MREATLDIAAAAPARFHFDRAGFAFVALLALAIAGFWPSYFSKLFVGHDGISLLFHVHAALNVAWIGVLIAQPTLIRLRRVSAHRFVGKVTYVLFPILVVSLFAAMRGGLEADDPLLRVHLFLPLRDVAVLVPAYCIAIYYRRDVAVHARAMIVTGIAFIDPALSRLIRHTVQPDPVRAIMDAAVCLAVLLVFVILGERHARRGRWVFPTVLAVYLASDVLLLFKLQFAPWIAFAHWFMRLPLP